MSNDVTAPYLGERLLSRRQVEEKCSMSRSAIYAGMREGDFPLPIKVGRQAVRWRMSELDAWLEGRERATGDFPERPAKPATAGPDD